MSAIGAQIMGGSAKDPTTQQEANPQATGQIAGSGAAAGKVKVNISADTERGEATTIGGIMGTGVAISTGMNKSNLAMAGSNILGDKSTLLKKKTNEGNLTQQTNQVQNSKYKKP